MTTPIPYTKPSISNLEVEFATDAARNGWGAQCYAYIERFERQFAEHIDTKYAIATSSCTGALHMGLASLGVGPGDEVILADTNWIATAAPIVHLGATPIFVDILPETWCIDPCLAEKAITSKTKAIIAVHLYGNLCALNELLAIGEKHGIPIIEDAAEAIGSIFHGRRAGSLGHFATFSFHGTKTMTSGEGGMFVTSDEELYDRVLTLSNHGRSKKERKQFWPERIGFKYKMSNIQAAIGCAQLERIEELIARKREILAYYRSNLTGFDQVSLNREQENCVCGAWMPTAVYARDAGVTTEQLISAFSRENIDARVFFHPLSALPMFEANPNNKHAYDISERAINLPSYHDITCAEMDRVLAILKQVLKK